MQNRNTLGGKNILLLALWALTTFGAFAQPSVPAFNIIPVPQQLTPVKGQFILNPATLIQADTRNEDLKVVANYLNNAIKNRAGYALAINTGTPKGKSIGLQLNPGMTAAEGYNLTVNPKMILIQAKTGAGLFYGVQSLLQLLPDGKSQAMALPAVVIQDNPAFGYRGMHLDVGRHFFPVAFIKQYIDMMARYKLNRFHWHLTEDQGWRIEIKKYPKLQEIAAYRKETLIGHYSNQPQRFDGQRYGGYYTQDEIREVVQYARERFIEVIPEIEMPGHAQAAIVAYPELGCTGKQIEVATKWGVFEDVFCPSEQTFEFLENVLVEVMALFPSEYIHIGGDECPKTQWKSSALAQEVIRREGLKDEHELQSYFIQRIEKFLNANGKKIIGWDEILEGGLAPNATVMSWRGEEGGIEAAKQRHDVIMTPTGYMYFDYYQAIHPDEPLAIGGFLPLEKVYSYNPIPKELNAEEAKHILGAQANLWTEYIQDGKKVEYMTYPRMLALSEVVWSGESKKNFMDFAKRLTVHTARLQAEGINIANHLYDIQSAVTAGDGKGIGLVFSNLAKAGTIRYTNNGAEPTAASPAAGGRIPVTQSGVYKGATFVNGKAQGRKGELSFQLHKAAGKKITLSNPPSQQYQGAGPGSVINGVMGSDQRYGDAEWLGFSGKDFEAIIDLGEPTPVKKINFRFFNSPGQWIYPPKEVKVSLSNDPSAFPAAQHLDVSSSGSDRIIRVSILANGSSGRYLRVQVPNFGLIPEGRQGAGRMAWLFVDEIVVE